MLFSVYLDPAGLSDKRLGREHNHTPGFCSKGPRGEGNDPSVIFPRNEIGETGKEIVRIYKNLARNAEELTLQKEKLFRHLHVLNEGVAFFSPEREVTLSNNHFMVFLNAITGKHTLSPEGFLDHPLFAPIKTFLDDHQNIPREKSRIHHHRNAT